jgi:tetratricopeptide (TPR) repeat protein
MSCRASDRDNWGYFVLYFNGSLGNLVGMSAIEPPDGFYVAAAVGWLELGNASEARLELARINPGLMEHPEVLEVRWQVAAAGPDWEAALDVAEKMIQVKPEKDMGWLHRAYALRRVKGGSIERAWAALRPAFELFPKTWLVAYNLACYAVQLGRLDEGWDWLNKAVESAGEAERVCEMALADSDLEPLWERIRGMG